MCGFKITFELWPESYYLMFSSGEEKTVASRLGLLTSRLIIRSHPRWAEFLETVQQGLVTTTHL